MIQRSTHEQAERMEGWASLLRLPSGIEGVGVNHRAGNVLVRYDPSRLSEEAVLSYVRGLSRFVLRYWDQFAALPPECVPSVLARLEDLVSSSLHRRVEFDHNVRVPDGFWQSV